MAFSTRQQTSASPVPRQTLTAIVGGVQSGKTGAIIERIKASTHLCVVIVRNVTTDVAQFVGACSRAKLPVRTYASNRCLTGRQNIAIAPRVIVLLANATNVKNCHKDVVPTNTPFSLFVDEADKIMFGDEGGERSFRSELERLMPYALELVLVTATTFNFMKLPHVGGKITAANIIVVPRRSNYCGIEDIRFGDYQLFDASDDPDDPAYIEADAMNPDTSGRLPGSYTTWVRTLSSSEDRAEMAVIGQPKLALARLGLTIATILSSAREARKVDPSILTVVFTGDGVAVPYELCNALNLASTRWKRSPHDYRILTGLNLQQTLSLLRDSEYFHSETTILVCAGILAGRCVNFCDDRYKWALTHEYFLAAKTTTVTELHQGLRLLGNKPWSLDVFRPRVMAKHSVMNNIRIGNVAHDNVVTNVADGTSQSLMHAVMETDVPDRPSVRYAANLTSSSIAKRQRTV